MAVSFTPQQQMVIDLRERNILVSAAAGSGKTAVLVERIIQMISDEEHKVDIDRLLVVTFTNAAAAEMRERISRAIDARLQNEPENAHLQRQAALLHNAQITTIDSFCLFVIRNNFNDIGLDPGFRVADEGELRLLKQDVLSELLEEKYEQAKEEFLACTEYFTGGSNDKILEEYILKLYEFSMSYPWPEEWLLKREKDYEITSVTEMEESDWCRYLTEYIQVSFQECADRLARARKLAEMPAGPYYYGSLLEQEEEMLKRVSQKTTFRAIGEAAEGIVFGRLPSKKDESVDEELKKQVQGLRNQVKKQVEELKEDFLLLSPEQVAARMGQAKEPVKVLLRLVSEFKQRFDARKRQENIIDFPDMEHFALNILLQKKEDGSLQATAAAKEYRQFFYEILIDEYQDSNLVQELLLQSISGEDEGRFNRFMVGDVKQSIYKFRLARPELFIEKYTCYEKVDSLRQRIDLHKNFRSRPQVLASVNDLFRKIMHRELGGVEYDDDAALYPGATFPEYGENRTETVIIGKMQEERLSVREQEALAVAGRIKRLIAEFKVTDKDSGKLRPARYGDIVILLRTTSGWAEDFKQVFEKEGIPAYVASRTGYFQAPEIKELLQLLHVLDNPLQDIPFYGVMRSFFGAFTDEEIALIRGKGEKGCFLYENVKSFANEEIKENADKKVDEEETTLAKKVSEFLTFLRELRYQASYTPIHTLIQNVLSRTGYLEYISAKPGGGQRRANVEMLLTKAAAFEKTSYYGLFHFLRYIKQLEKYQVDYGEADITDENADVVRIMSIHKSKGLEFPICFVSGLSKRFNRQDTTGRLIADADMGIGVDYIDNTRRIQSKTLRKNAVAMKMKLDSLGEEIRVLYVAMTRAKEKLILTALVNDIDKWKEGLKREAAGDGAGQNRLSFSALSKSNCFLDLVAPCVEDLTYVYPEDMLHAEVRETIETTGLLQRLLMTEADKRVVTELSHKFKRTYLHQYLSELFVKTTVSELKKAAYTPKEDGDAFSKELFEEPEIVPYIPSFIKAKEGMSGTDRGSAYHKVMELLDFTAFYGIASNTTKESDERCKKIIQELHTQADTMEAGGKLSHEWRGAVSADKLCAFLQTNLAKRMMAAAAKKKLYKEQPFVLGLSADRVKDSFPDTEMVLMQGIIDVYFEEEDGIVVADYKTDRVQSADELVKRYYLQLDYYAEALERLTGKPVKEKIIYSFALGKEIALDK